MLRQNAMLRWTTHVSSSCPTQIQDPARFTILLCHIWAESLGWHCNALLAQVNSRRSREYICSASRESRGCGTEGEQYAWPLGCLYLWFDKGI